jgi:hypothetical protein
MVTTQLSIHYETRESHEKSSRETREDWLMYLYGCPLASGVE